VADFCAYKYSTSHLFFPRIIITLLIVLGLIIVIPKLVAALRAKGAGAASGETKQRWHFFAENYDKLKFWGTPALLILYVLALDMIHFVPASLIFIFLFNALFCGTREKKSLLISALISVVATMTVYLVFGVLFHVTLP